MKFTTVRDHADRDSHCTADNDLVHIGAHTSPLAAAWSVSMIGYRPQLRESG
jgi:hypothetical protein